jgi:hypothetical protein
MPKYPKYPIPLGERIFAEPQNGCLLVRGVGRKDVRHLSSHSNFHWRQILPPKNSLSYCGLLFFFANYWEIWRYGRGYKTFQFSVCPPCFSPRNTGLSPSMLAEASTILIYSGGSRFETRQEQTIVMRSVVVFPGPSRHISELVVKLRPYPLSSTSLLSSTHSALYSPS